MSRRSCIFNYMHHSKINILSFNNLPEQYESSCGSYRILFHFFSPTPFLINKNPLCSSFPPCLAYYHELGMIAKRKDLQVNRKCFSLLRLFKAKFSNFKTELKIIYWATSFSIFYQKFYWLSKLLVLWGSSSTALISMQIFIPYPNVSK